jgi:transposase InsO family protein
MNDEFACQHNFHRYQLKTPKTIEVIDGRPISSSDITEYIHIDCTIGDHHEKLVAYVASIGHYPLILRIPWLKKHDMSINFPKMDIQFPSPNRLAHRSKITPTPIKGITTPQNNKICAISTTSFRRIVNNANNRYGTVEQFALSLYEINTALAKEDDKKPDIRTIVPPKYHDYLKIFEKANADKLPPHRPSDHTIPLTDGFKPPFGPLYSLSHPELQELKRWLDENLSKGFIRTSSSPAAAPILFVKKGDGSLRLVVDYRGINEGTIKNRYPLPLLQDTLMNLSKAKWFTKLDIRGAYNLICMAEGEEWKTAFRTRYCLFESLVMPFGLTNALATFQNYINDVLAPYLDCFCTAYLDDTLIYSDNFEEHQQHVRLVLDAFAKAGLHLKPKQCEFHQQEVKYLGLIISMEGIKMDPEKIRTVQDWEPPSNLKDVRAFLGFANFYCRFVRHYSRIVQPLTFLTRKGVPFAWSMEQQTAFDTLKATFTSAPVLARFDPDRDVIVEMDASDYISAGVLSQYDDDNVLHPMAYFSKKHSPTECNYKIYDKELMAIVRAFKEWRPELQSVINPIRVLSDHKNLEYFTTTKLLNRRQARWSQFLSQFNFKIVYRPGTAGGKPDALTPRSRDLPKAGDDRSLENQTTIIKPENILQLSAMATPIPASPALVQLFTDGYNEDPFPNKILKLIRDGAKHCREISLAECDEHNNLLCYHQRIWVPNYEPLKLHLLQQHHDVLAAGHPGRSKTLQYLCRNYTWPKMRTDVDRYTRNCHTCQRTKPSRHAPFGVLRPLPIPDRPWQDISMDFVTVLPWSNGCDAIWVVVDHLTKERHLVPCRMDVDAKELPNLFIAHIFRLHGLPLTIISDRGPQFAALFWKNLCRRLGIQPRLSTAFHPQTDGQTERMNAVMEQYLRAHVNYLQDDWAEWLPLAEFAANNQASETTGSCPFFANKGFDPHYQFDLLPVATNDINDQ